MPATSTITIQQIIDWLKAYVVQRPMTGVAGIANEPALSCANYIMQTILQPPFRWSWNRVNLVTAFTTTAGVSDYTIAPANFGWLEKAVVNYVTVPTGINPNYEIEVSQIIAKDIKQNRPQKIAKLIEDGSGNVTFRLFPTPDQPYDVDLLYQKAPVLAITLGGTTWTPIPDKYEFLYMRGMTAMLQMMYNPQAAFMNLEVFYRQLVAVAEGLNDEERAIFLEDALRPIRMRQFELLGTQQGKQARL